MRGTAGVQTDDDAERASGRLAVAFRGVPTAELLLLCNVDRGVAHSRASPGAAPRMMAGTPPGVVTELVCLWYFRGVWLCIGMPLRQ